MELTSPPDPDEEISTAFQPFTIIFQMLRRQWDEVKFLVKARPSVFVSLIVIAAFFTLIHLRYGGQIILTDSSISLPTGAMLLFSITSLVAGWRPLLTGTHGQRRHVIKRAGNIVLDWLPFPMLLFVYENLRGRIWLLAKNDFTPWLAHTDIAMFGAHPTIFMEKFYNPSSPISWPFVMRCIS